MIKRLTWFVSGAVAGAAGAGVVKRKVRATAAGLAPANVARTAGRRVREAVTEGREAMRSKEAELRSRLDGHPLTLADRLDDDEELLVDGERVEPGRVIVMRPRRRA